LVFVLLWLKKSASIAKLLEILFSGGSKKALAGFIFIRNTQDAGNYLLAGNPDWICKENKTGSAPPISTQFPVHEQGIISMSPVNIVLFPSRLYVRIACCSPSGL